MASREPLTDLLCVCPHSDDAEIALGGALRLLADRGRRVVVADLTAGELGSNGTPEQRWDEARAAADVLGLHARLRLDLPDGFISAEDPAQVGAVTALIREMRPRWVVSAPEARRHPDHRAIHPLVEKAAFMARLRAYRPEPPAALRHPDAAPGDPAEGWVCEAVLRVCAYGEQPAAIFDVSGVWRAKTEALACFASQFDPDRGRRTMINSPAFMQEIERRARAWGFRAGVEYAEALAGTAAPLLRDMPGQEWR